MFTVPTFVVTSTVPLYVPYDTLSNLHVQDILFHIAILLIAIRYWIWNEVHKFLTLPTYLIDLAQHQLYTYQHIIFLPKPIVWCDNSKPPNRRKSSNIPYGYLLIHNTVPIKVEIPQKTCGVWVAGPGSTVPDPPLNWGKDKSFFFLFSKRSVLLKQLQLARQVYAAAAEK